MTVSPKKPRNTIKPKLTGMMLDWVLIWLADPKRNATDAARKAGYKNPEKSGWENRHNPKVQQYIEDHYLSQHMEVNEILARLADQGRANLESFIELEQQARRDKETGEMILKEDGNPVLEYTGAFWIDLVKAKQAGVLHWAKEIKETKHVFTDKEGNTETTYRTSVKIVESQAALDKLAKAAGLYGPKGDQDDPLHTVGMTLDEWREEQERKRQQREDETAETLDLFECDEDV